MKCRPFIFLFLLIPFTIQTKTHESVTPKKTKVIKKKVTVQPQPSKPDTPSFLTLNSNDVMMKLGGGIKEDYFLYKNVRTLRNNLGGNNTFFRHKFNLDWSLEQGRKHYGAPASEAAVRLTNYVYWQQYGAYTPLMVGDLRAQDMDNVIIAHDVKVQPLVPLIFAEEAWFKLNFETFAKVLQDRPTFLKVGFFKYEVGRGLAMGYHNDLAVDHLGWPGKGNYSRYYNMPPGILFRMHLAKNWTGDLYFMKWHELGATLADTNSPTRAQRLDGYRPDRGCNKDRENYVLKFDYTPKDTAFGDVHLEPYLVYTQAPEQTIEFEADASSYLATVGTMVNFAINNFEVNVELAGQFGYQDVHAIDRNTKILGKNGSVTYSHIVYEDGGHAGQTRVQVRRLDNAPDAADNTYNPATQLLDSFINNETNKNLSRQGQRIQGITIDPRSGFSLAAGGAAPVPIYNATFFGNNRFRPAYRLSHQGVMALADVSYTFKELPYKLAVAAGYISGGEYPYNEETDKTYRGFVPMRSLYEGLFVKNILIFDRLDLPRPLDLSHRTLYAQNNLLDLSNLQFLGFGFTWYPFQEKKKLSITTDVLWLWEVAQLKKWSRYATHPDTTIENQLKLDRAKLGFPGVARRYDPVHNPADNVGNSGWFTDEDASRSLGAEIDIKAFYQIIDHCDAFAKLAIFIPGGLYHDLEGQPNILTRHTNELGQSVYDSLGTQIAVGFILGLNYKF